MKLKNIMEEMGMLGMDRIKKNFLRLVKRLNLPREEYDIISKGGTFYMIYKNKKPFARIPSSKVMDANYLTGVLKKEL